MIDRIKQGDIRAFEALYRTSHRKVYSFARKHTRDELTAEDLAHDVFLKIWQNRQTLSDTIPLDAQLLTIARQLIVNQYRRGLVRQQAFDAYTHENTGITTADEASNLLNANDLQGRYQRAMSQLPSRRREIFELSRVEQLSYDEIAERLAISRATVESQMVKALKFLRERLTSLFFFL